MTNVAYTAAHGVLDAVTVDHPYVEVDPAGTIVRATAGVPDDAAPLVHDLGPSLLLPGMVNAHSHAFQRAIRGMTHRRAQGDPSDFWSWRTAMYEAASTLDPDGLYTITRQAYAEMAHAGITCVGEFHYVHHNPDGSPYADPNELSRQVLRAAGDVGIRVVLLEVFYARSGAGAPPLPEQRRFCDASVDAYLARVDVLRTEGVDVGITPHSIRAVGADDLRRLAAYAHEHDLPLHAHVSEQPRENEACQAEHGMTPTALFDSTGCLDRPRRFTAVHAVHVTKEDLGRLATQHVCACPTTEADLGDGIVPAVDLATAGTVLSLGSDSNAVIDLVQEARLLEMGERLRTGRRLCLGTTERPAATAALDAATTGGASALGQAGRLGRLTAGRPFDACVVDLLHPSLAGVPGDRALDALLLAGTAAPVAATFVGGRRIV